MSADLPTQWVVEATIGESVVRVLCGAGPEPPTATVAWLGEAAAAKWHPTAPSTAEALVGALESASTETVVPLTASAGHGIGSEAGKLAAVLGLCRGTRSLGGVARVCALGRGRLIRGEWRPEETALDARASLADTLFAGARGDDASGYVVRRARVYTQSGPGALEAEADAVASLEPEAQATVWRAEARAARVGGMPEASAGGAGPVGGAGEEEDSDEDDARPVRRR